jgi:CRISPR system Cascade subunit CasA
MMGDGEVSDLSLANALIRAHQVREIFDESPLVTAALHRLLLAILHRNFGPGGKRAWVTLWSSGRWNEKNISDYFDKWRERFELFHPERPFYQVREMNRVACQPVAILFQELAAGNNTTLFDHSFETSSAGVPAARAARALVARQAYSIGFGKSNPFYFSDSPLLRGLTVLVTGRNLFETLALNLLRYDEVFPRARDRHDLPVWEQERPAAARKEGNHPAGYLDYLTWQSRRVHLYPEANGLEVHFCQLQQNLKLAQDTNRDPFKCYRRDDKRGWVALSFREDRALWRDSHSLIASRERPGVFDWVAQVASDPAAHDIGVGPYFSFSAFGLATDRGKAASVTFWRHERLPLPLAYLSDAELLGRVASAIDYAEETGADLRDSLWVFASTMFQPLDSKGNQRRSDDARRLLDELAPQRLYWPALESPFIVLMTDLVKLEPDCRESRVLEWRKLVRLSARRALDQITRQFYSGAREFRSVAQAERTFRQKIRRRLALGEVA